MLVALIDIGARFHLICFQFQWFCRTLICRFTACAGQLLPHYKDAIDRPFSLLLYVFSPFLSAHYMDKSIPDPFSDVIVPLLSGVLIFCPKLLQFCMLRNSFQFFVLRDHSYAIYSILYVLVGLLSELVLK